MRLRGSSAIRQDSNSIWLYTSYSTCGLKQHCLFCLWTLHLYCNTNTYPVWWLMLLGVSKVNWQQRGSHQGNNYKWQNCTWKQQLQALLRQCVKWIGKIRSRGRVFGWECGSVSVCCHVCITGAWQLRNSDVQFGVTSESEMFSCRSTILWQYAISTRCHGWRDMTLWMSALMHFKKRVVSTVATYRKWFLSSWYSQWNVLFTLISEYAVTWVCFYYKRIEFCLSIHKQIFCVRHS